MEEKFQLRSSSSSSSSSSSMEGGLEVEVEAFYEEIEAPKFVDFTLPNHFSPDDRFWFCSRVGCDQRHEEEMDSEAINKNFVLRVMAARSPNVRFRRALSRKPPSESKKCPLSAPPKPSKSRLPRLALVNASISKKLINEENGKVPASTPKPRVKHVAAKYMTSPRKRKGSSPDPNAFRSVHNPKKTSILLPKSKIVAKALVFNSPKKALKKKASLELGTPITKLCEGVKKLQITSQKKASLELGAPINKLCERVKKLQINSEKKGIIRKPSKDCSSEKKLPLDSSRKIPSSSKEKKREIDAKFSRTVKSKAKTKERKHADIAQLEVGKSGDESSDMEIDEKSRCGSLELGSQTIKPRTGDHDSAQEGTSSSERPMTGGSSETESSDTQKSERNSGSDSEDKISAKDNSVSIQAPVADEQGQEKSNSNSDDLENQNPGVVSELKDNIDKENALNFADIRNLNCDNLSKQEAPVKLKVKTKQIPQKLDKNSKENCPVGTGTQGLKNKKLKPTNPKPFRLRTDERGILKEATLERKVKSHENSSTTSDNTQGMGNGVSVNREKGSKKDEGRILKKDQLKLIRSRYKTLKGVEQKSFLQKQVEGPQRDIVSHVKCQGLSSIEKPKTTMSRPKVSRKQGKEVDPTHKASITQKSGGQGKRPAIIPREPNFHSLQKPKSCIRNKP